MMQTSNACHVGDLAAMNSDQPNLSAPEANQGQKRGFETWLSLVASTCGADDARLIRIDLFTPKELIHDHYQLRFELRNREERTSTPLCFHGSSSRQAVLDHHEWEGVLEGGEFFSTTISLHCAEEELQTLEIHGLLSRSADACVEQIAPIYTAKSRLHAAGTQASLHLRRAPSSIFFLNRNAIKESIDPRLNQLLQQQPSSELEEESPLLRAQ
ncbi:MAG: hypothetical protein MK135_00895 [Polyangiaceae bacterium]|nr:hypothetical protein [Polyangiaceae bacterium]